MKMALEKSSLKIALSNAFSKSSKLTNTEDPNLLPSSLCSDIASAYDTWFSKATLSTLIPKSVEILTFSKSLRSNKFSSWGTSFSSYCDSVIWIPTNPAELSAKIVNSSVAGVTMQLKISAYIAKRQVTFGTTEEFIDTIVDIIYTYTKELVGVIVIPTVPGTKPGVLI